MPHHPPHTFHTLDEFLLSVIGPGYSPESRHYRFWVRKWNAWKARHPGLPYRIKCAICSGKEAKIDRKLGKVKDNKKPRREEVWE